MFHILVADDDDAILELLSDFLSSKGYRVEQARNGQEVLQKLQTNRPHALLLDNRMPDMDGLSVLRQMKTTGLDTPVILITAHSTSSVAVNSAQLGAFDYLPKPLDLDKVEETLQRLIEHTQLTRQLAGFEEPTPSDSPLTGCLPGLSSVSRRVRETAEQLAVVERPVFIYGEIGAGKAFLARTLHDCSPRHSGPFVQVDCGTGDSAEKDVELFGQQRDPSDTQGRLKKGALELASGGTLFLAEITALPLTLQQQILETFQTNQFRRLGSTRDILLDVRLIVSSTADLEQAVAQGTLHEGWLKLFDKATLHLPPLRERIEDLPMLAQNCLAHLHAEGTERPNVPPTEITPEAIRRLQQHRWPRNLLELKNVLSRAKARAGHSPIGLEHLDFPPMK